MTELYVAEFCHPKTTKGKKNHHVSYKCKSIQVLRTAKEYIRALKIPHPESTLYVGEQQLTCHTDL